MSIESAPRPEELDESEHAEDPAAIPPAEEVHLRGGEATDLGELHGMATAPAEAIAEETAEAHASPAGVAGLAAKRRRDARAESKPAEPTAPAEEAGDREGVDEFARHLGFADAAALLRNFDLMRTDLADPLRRGRAQNMLKDSSADYRHAYAAYDASRTASEAEAGTPGTAESGTAEPSDEAETTEPATDASERAEADPGEHTTETPEAKIARLEAENVALRSEVAGLRDDVARLTTEVARLRELLEAAGIADPTRTAESLDGPGGDGDRGRRERERYEVAKADPDAVDVYRSVREQEEARLRKLLDQWRSEGLVTDPDTLDRMWKELFLGVASAASAASLAAGNARREADTPRLERALNQKDAALRNRDQEIADLRARMPKRTRKKFDMDAEESRTDEEGDEHADDSDKARRERFSRRVKGRQATGADRLTGPERRTY